MKKILFLILAVAFCCSLSAQPYTSKHFQDVKVASYNAPANGASENSIFIPSNRPSDYVPQNRFVPNIIGETYYIAVTNCNSRNTINWSPDGTTCAASWTMGSVTTGSVPSGYRGTGLNYLDESTQGWGPMPSVDPIDRIEDLPMDKGWAPGWGAHVYTEEGECVISHCTKEGGMVVNTRDQRGEGEWEQNILQGPEYDCGPPTGVTTSILWPTVFSVGNTVHMVCVTEQNATGSPCVPGFNGMGTCPLYFRSTDGGKTWEPPRTFDGVIPYEEQVDVSADNYVLTARGEHVVIAFARGNAFYLESFDGGDTWERHLVYDCSWSWSSEGSWIGPLMYASGIAVSIGDDGVVHIAFSAAMRERSPDTLPNWYSQRPALCGLYTWNSRLPMMTEKEFGIEFDTINEEFISLDYDLLPNFMNAPDILGLGDFYWWTGFLPLQTIVQNYGGNGYISHPRLIASRGKVYLMYSSIIEQPFLSNDETFYRGVFLTVSHDNGETYDQRKNTSWLSYHPDMFFIDWTGYEPYPEDTAHNGSADIIKYSDNGYPSMAPTIGNNSLIFTWFNDLYPFPETKSGWNPWQSFSFSVLGNNLKIWSAGSYNNTDSVWRGICNKIEEKEVIHNLNIYPNPASDKITVETGTNNLYTLTVSNIMGQVLYSTKGMNSKVDLNVANYPAGIYIVNVKTAHATASKKLIIK